MVGNSASVEGATIQNNANAEISSINTRIQANNLNNLENSDGTAATIAARERLDLGVSNFSKP